jgi:hypothetical protein
MTLYEMKKMTSYRAEQIWKAFKGELIVEPTDDMREALSTAIRVVAERLYTDLGEMQDPSVVLEEIADELNDLEELEKLK